MKKSTVPTALVGIAGVHYVAAELSRRGLIALPTIRNTAGYDIIVATPDGSKHANIQVKTSLKKAMFWPMPPSNKVRTLPNDYYVLVRWIEREKRFEGFLLDGREAKEAVEDSENKQGKRIKSGHRKSLFPSINVGAPWAEQENRWRSQWEAWGL